MASSPAPADSEDENAGIPNNLSSGLASLASADIFNEIGSVFLKTRSRMAKGERKQDQDRENIADAEQVKPRTQENIDLRALKIYLNSLPEPKAKL